MQVAAYADTFILSTHADQDLLYRETAALRLLRLMQAWAAEHVVEPGRGCVWLAQKWLQSRIGVSRSQLYRVLSRLQSSGWIEPSTVPDSTGRERPGFRVALVSANGFATAMRPRCDIDATPMRHNCDFPTLKLKEENVREDRAAMTRAPRQSSLPGSEFETPIERPGSETRSENGTMGTIRRDPRIKEAAARVDEYERGRYIQHPRATRPKRDSPQAHALSLEAIRTAMEAAVESGRYETIEKIETTFRAVVELNWSSAVEKQETWDWWTGSAMWSPRSLERVLGWLEEKRNWIYLDRASGKSPIPQVAAETGKVEGDIADLSPAEQQAEYDRRHGIETVGPIVPDGADPETYVHPKIVMGIDHAVPGGDETGVFIEFRDGHSVHSLRELLRPGTVYEEEGIRKWDMPAISLAYTPAPEVSDVELRKASERKLDYVMRTTPEERDADAKAGRKPWEVG